MPGNKKEKMPGDKKSEDSQNSQNTEVEMSENVKEAKVNNPENVKVAKVNTPENVKVAKVNTPENVKVVKVNSPQNIKVVVVNNPLTSTQRFNTPLHLAVHHGSDEIVQLLINKGADVNVKNEAHFSPLHVAIKKGHQTTVKILLQNGADINAENNDGQTPLYFAVELGHSAIVKDLLKHGPEPNKSNGLSLHCAVRGTKKSREIVSDLLKHGFVVKQEDINNKEFIRDSVKNGHLEVVTDLLKFGADVNLFDKGFSLLHNAAKNGQEELVRLLVNHKVDLDAKDKKGRTALWYALEKEHVNIVRFLLFNKVNVNDRCKPLHIAIRNGHKELVKILLKARANPNSLDDEGNTALHIALSLQHDDIEEIATMLLNNKAKVNAKAHDGKTPLHLAAANGHEKVAKLLLESGADVNSRC